MESFSTWLEQTKPSLFVQDVLWIIPAVQSVHILAISIIVTSLVLLDLKLVGIGFSHNSMAYLERRFMPWIWAAFWVLLASGLVLTVGEPKRELMNYVFRAKLILIAVLVGAAALVQRATKADPEFWRHTAGRIALGRVVGIASLLVLIATIACGRWIAYAGMIEP